MKIKHSVEKSKVKIDKEIENACEIFRRWKPDLAEMHEKAFHEYDKLKASSTKNIIKPSLCGNIQSILFNMTYYNVLGKNFYKQQLKQNFKLVMNSMEPGLENLKNYLLFLYEDMNNGPASGRFHHLLFYQIVYLDDIFQ